MLLFSLAAVAKNKISHFDVLPKVECAAWLAHRDQVETVKDVACHSVRKRVHVLVREPFSILVRSSAPIGKQDLVGWRFSA
jgi:hypothetical protein